MKITKVILIHYDELILKSKIVKLNFIKQLKNNIKKSLKEFETLQYYLFFNHLEINNFKDEEWNLIKEKLTNVFGISNFSLMYKFPKNFNVIKDKIITLLSNENKAAKTFKLFIKRNDKSYTSSSRTMIEELAKIILKNTDLTVNIKNPDLKIYLNINSNGIYYFASKIEGAKGLPVGSSGKVLLLISAGIDSPVAAWKLMKRGLEVIFLHFTTPPQTSPESINKVKNLVKILKPYNKNSDNLYLCNFLALQNELMHIKLSNYRITLMRRMFIKIANQLATTLEITALATGESLGQVASQTLSSISVINEISKLPILRPLIAADKLEIIHLANKINTYKTSILPFDDCCSLFVPKNPITQPKIATVKKLEKNLEKIINIEELINLTTKQISKLNH